MFRLCAAVVVCFLATRESQAHYHVLLPDKTDVAAGEEVKWTFRFGHPFEHEFFDASAPAAVYVVHPDGTRTDLTKSIEKYTFAGSGGKMVAGYRFAFAPPKRGDYTLVAVAPAVTVQGEDLPLKDVVKCVLHVRTQNGWDQRVVDAKTAPIELSPLTRPYGLMPGATVQVEAETAAAERKPIVRCEIEIEKYNSAPPKALPPDEFVTRTARTDRAGSASVTLLESGWWAITANHDDGKVRHRSTFWMLVSEPAK
ncbi:MAG: DUF4198 domain-containing protein [Planctomycetia bacterium]|nr:DUF4198 domain-containing protein [Planctomycetia bacterium]